MAPKISKMRLLKVKITKNRIVKQVKGERSTMKWLSILLFVVMVNLSSCTTNQENEIAKKDVSSSFQPKPLDDDWSM